MAERNDDDESFGVVGTHKERERERERKKCCARGDRDRCCCCCCPPVCFTDDFTRGRRRAPPPPPPRGRRRTWSPGRGVPPTGRGRGAAAAARRRRGYRAPSPTANGRRTRRLPRRLPAAATATARRRRGFAAAAAAAASIAADRKLFYPEYVGLLKGCYCFSPKQIKNEQTNKQKSRKEINECRRKHLLEVHEGPFHHDDLVGPRVVVVAAILALLPVMLIPRRRGAGEGLGKRSLRRRR